MRGKKRFDVVRALRASLSAHEERKAGRLSLQETRVPIPDADVKAIRARLNLSQQEFANRFGLSVGSLRNWEQGTRRPEQPVALLLHLIARDPERVANEVKRLKKHAEA
jgi:putative transcriptional regulator